MAKNPFMHYVPDFEKEAEDFLRKYECADAIDTPRPIPIRDIATRLMSLDIVDTEYLSFDGSVQGAIAFTRGIIDVYDWSTEQNIGYEVYHPTIFVDADILNLGGANNTLAHECFHWWRHRNYFNFKRTHENGAEFAFRCNNRISQFGSLLGGEWSNEDKMEWQAKTIAPKILMPRNAFRSKVDATYRQLTGDNKNICKRAVTSTVLDIVSGFFEVSKQSAAIRMLELGYPEAEEYCGTENTNNRRTQTANRAGSTAKYHLRPITPVQAFELYCTNDLLKAALDTGAFHFTEGYFIFNDDKYLHMNASGKRVLTPYAKEHLPECALDFSVRLVSDSLMHSQTSIMYRSDSIFKEESSFEANTQNTELFNKAKDFEKKLQRSQAKTITPATWMKRRMEEENWYEYTFEERTKLDKMHYSRVQGGTHKFTMRPLVAMGVGLSLDLSEMEEVLRLGGMAFQDGDREQEAYKYLFTAFYGKGIDECNDFLEAVNVPTLGTQQRK